jgi:hypothetical protein
MYSLLSRLGLSAITELKNAFCLYIKNVASLLIHDNTREKVVVKELLTMKEKVIVLEYFAVSLSMCMTYSVVSFLYFFISLFLFIIILFFLSFFFFFEI